MGAARVWSGEAVEDFTGMIYDIHSKEVSKKQMRQLNYELELVDWTEKFY